jgi:Domain of unknown function (DUF397)
MDGWRKSSYSDANGGQCLETAAGNGQVMVRDTTDRAGATLTLSAGAWRSFTDALKK